MLKAILLFTLIALTSACSITYSNDSVFSWHKVMQVSHSAHDFNQLQRYDPYSIVLFNVYNKTTSKMLFPQCEKINDIKVDEHYYFAIARTRTPFTEQEVEITNLEEVICKKTS